MKILFITSLFFIASISAYAKTLDCSVSYRNEDYTGGYQYTLGKTSIIFNLEDILQSKLKYEYTQFEKDGTQVSYRDGWTSNWIDPKLLTDDTVYKKIQIPLELGSRVVYESALVFMGQPYSYTSFAVPYPFQYDSAAHLKIYFKYPGPNSSHYQLANNKDNFTINCSEKN